MVLRLKLKTRSLLRLTIVLTGMFWGTSALAESDLKQRITVQSLNVRLSDIFTAVSIDTDKDVFAAPMPGETLMVSTTEMWKLAQVNGIKWDKPSVNKRIRILREGQSVDLKILKTLLSDEIRIHGVHDDMQVSIFGLTNNLYLPRNSNENEIEISSLTVNSNKDRYRATLLWPLGDGSYKELALNGSIELVRLLPVLNRTLLPGEVVSKSDVQWINVPIKKITANTIQSVENFVGYTPRRAIAANRMLRNSDLEAVKYVKKGNQVTITYISGPLLMKTVGKALQHGAIGDPVRILNMRSNKTIIAQVTGPDQVEITHHSTARQLASR